jgi:uncharacterized protein YecE (DUF72 family)
MRLHAGTSGFAYDEWKGSFYPQDLPGSQMLRYYAEQFSTVEINNTFYRLPKENVLRQWAAQVPPGFTFVIKASQRITHMKRLKEAGEPLGYLLSNLAVLGPALGPLLFQLPPNMKKDVPRLTAFLELLPASVRAAFEFRHESWHDDEVYEALRRQRCVLCVADTLELSTPLLATSDWGYLRLRREAYDDAALADWATRTAAQPWTDAFVFFKHEDAGTGPRLARHFQQIFATAGA